MKSKQILTVLLASLVVFPAVYAAVVAGSSDVYNSRGAMALTFAVLAVQIIAFAQVIRVRAMFSRADAARVTWTLIAGFFLVYILTDIRLIAGVFNIFPISGNTYLYFFTVSDLLFIAALMTAIRLYKSTGLRFEIEPIDYFYIAGAWAIAIATVLAAYYQGHATDFSSVTAYREVAVMVGGVILSLGLVVRRYVSQMGGGAVAKVWNWVVVASFTRDISHLAWLIVPLWFPRYLFFAHLYLRWIFAVCWVLAATSQLDIKLNSRIGEIEQPPRILFEKDGAI